jgi:energy-converting hydrogenase Eha subunit H
LVYLTYRIFLAGVSVEGGVSTAGVVNETGAFPFGLGRTGAGISSIGSVSIVLDVGGDVGG